MINPTIKVTLVNLISQGKTKQAIELLLEVTNETALYSKVVLQSARYKDYKDEKNNGLSSYENEKINLTKINNSLLSIIQQIDEYVQQVDEDKVAHILLRGQNTQTGSKKNRPNIIKNNIKPNLSTSKKVGFIGLLIVLVICIQCVFYLNRPISTDEINHLKIGEKLNLGFRFLELRLKKTSKNALKVVGKTNQDIFFEDVQKELIHFLDKHPNETIFIAIQKEDSAAISTLLDQKIKQNLTYWYTSDYLPLKLNDKIKKKIVLLKKYDDLLANKTGIFVGYSNEENEFFTQKINNKGKLGSIIDNGGWKNDYSNLVGLYMLNNYFIARQSKDKHFSIQQIESDGIVDLMTYSRTWQNYYENLFSFQIEGDTYIAGQNSNRWFFIQKVEPDGRMGSVTYDNTWQDYYENLMSFSLGEQTYIAGHNSKKHFFIRKVESGGRLGAVTYEVTWGDYYGIIFPLKIGEESYIGGQSSNKRFFLQKVELGGQLSNETYSSKWKYLYTNLFSFEIGRHTYIAGQDLDKHFFIQKVMPGGRLGAITYKKTLQKYYENFLFF